MTEPKHSESERPEREHPEPERPPVQRPAAQWPDAASPTGDPLVDRALGLLHDVPETPVPDHGELYAGIHDALLEALDAEPGLPAVPRSTPSDTRPEGDS